MRIQSLFFAVTLAASALAIGCSSSGSEEEVDVEEGALNEKLADLPFYFGVPKTSLTQITTEQRKGYGFATAWLPTNESTELGLRVLAAEDSAAGRRMLSTDLSKPEVGLLKTGDVLLTFRIENANTIPYVHLTMGISHAGLVNVDARNMASSVDQPLDTKHNSPGKPFTSEHYSTVKAIHIVRPAVLERDPSRREKLSHWQGLANSLVGERSPLAFNSNYLAPATGKYGFDPRQAPTVSTDLGKALARHQPAGLSMFCSEMAYHLLTLSNCTEQEVLATPDGQAAQCAKDGLPFNMSSVFNEAGTGLGEGPLMAAIAGGVNPQTAVQEIFAGGGDSPSISSGHRDANKSLIEAGLIPAPGTNPLGGPVFANYQARLQAKGVAALANPEAFAKIPFNYAPVAFLINAMKEKSYVATVMFLSADKIRKASALAGDEIPATGARPTR